MPALLLACLAYLSVALPGSTLGLLWPSMRLSFGQPVGALGILLVPGIAASGVRTGPAPGEPAGAPASALGALTFTAVETGIESGAGIWGYLFLTSGRGLPPAAAGVAVAAYWAMMCAGRVVLGPVAERLGPARVLAAAVAGVPLGAMLMALPFPAPVPARWPSPG